MAFKLPLPRLRWTISGRIVFAFVAMSVVSIALGVITVMGADRAARMVRLTYDDVLVSNNYARAAAGDFANLRAHAAEQLRSGTPRKDPIDPIEAALRQSFQADLATAVEKAGAADLSDLAGQLRAAEAAWVEQSHKLGPKPPMPAIVELDAKTRAVEDKVEALVSRVTERGFAYREQARAMVDRDAQFALGGVAAAIACAGCVALLLSRRISKPIGQAARFAGQIASGSLDGEPPAHGRDEVGDLIDAMIQMRGNIAAMMSRQAVLQEQSQARVVGALEDCEEGIVVIDPLGVVQIANRRALDQLGLVDDPLPPDETIEALLARVQRRDPARIRLLQVSGKAHEIEEIALPDGRWIRSSRQITSEGGLVALYTDITAIKDQQERLGEANATLDAALGNMSQGLCLFDAENRLKLANTRFRALSGLTASQCAPGTPYRDIVAQALVVAGGNTAGLDRLMRHERAVIRRRRATDRSIVLGARTIAITQSPMADGGWLATYEDVTERKRAETQIAFLANHDALTHLPNRTMFGKKVEEAIVRARRGTAFAIHCLDLDHFKQVNDTLGHAFGDQLLRAVTDRLLGCVREIDTVARLGGDEFAVLQADVTSPEQVATLAQRMVEALAAPYVIEGHDIMIAASVGIALSPGDGMTHGLLLKSADAALYKSKEEGRRTWRFFESAMDESLQARHALEADLRRALQNEEFEVFFQPLLDARNAQIASFEALVRWRHPIRGLVPPDQFIPIAEETGAIKDIGIWVLNAACREATRWPSHMRVAVNVSTIQLREADFAQTVTSALARSGLPADRLELEITESVFMANTTKIMPILTGLRGIGVRFAMDDFGTGYSSLSTLRAFPFDKIKIDRSFIRDLSAAEAAGQIIRTILALGRSLGMRVTAEGVETRAQLEFLEQEGCDEIQGYLVGRPMPAGEVIERLARDSDRGWMNRAA